MRVFNLLKTRVEEMEEKGDVEGLIQSLEDDTENIRREAVMALERIGDFRATEPLIKTLEKDPDKTIQEEGITALGRIQDKKAIPYLIERLNNQHIGIRWRAAEALGRIGDPKATDPLLQTLNDPDKTIQEETITALGRIKDKKAVPYLIESLTNKNIGIRWRAAEALGRIGDPKATESLSNSLNDHDVTMQETTITALGRIALDPFIQDFKSNNQDRKDAAIISIKQLKDLEIRTYEKASKRDENLEKHETDLDETDEVSEISEKPQSTIAPKEEIKPPEKPDLEAKKTKLIKSGYYVYIENFVKNSCYNFFDGFNKKYRYDYEFTEIRKLRDLLQYRGMEFSDDEVLWLIKEEIKNQEYVKLKDKILAEKPVDLTDYVKILIKDYTDPKEHTEQLQKLLDEHNIHTENLSQEIDRIQKNMEILAFENKILAKEAQAPDEKDSPSIIKEFRKKELNENRELMRANGKYVYIENFVRKSCYYYEFGDIQKFRELLNYKGIIYSKDDLLWLIKEEIKNQEYLKFRDKILSENPENLSDYIKAVMNNYVEPKKQLKQLKNLLKEKQLQSGNLEAEIEKTQKHIEITEFENKILDKEVDEDVLPVEMEDLDDAYIAFNIGNLFYDLGKFIKALSYYDAALHIYPDYIEAWRNRGLIFFTRGRLQKAAACYTQILNLDPEYPELWIDIGVLFFEIGNTTEAKACYERAVELNPCYPRDEIAQNTRRFLEKNPQSLGSLDNFLELASSASWESSDRTPPLSRIMMLINKNFKD